MHDLSTKSRITSDSVGSTPLNDFVLVDDYSIYESEATLLNLAFEICFGVNLAFSPPNTTSSSTFVSVFCVLLCLFLL